MFGPAAAAARAGDPVQAIRLMYEAVYGLPPGGFDGVPPATQKAVLDNARTMPLLFAAPPPPPITCDTLKNFRRPTLVVRGDKTQPFYALTSDAIATCVPGARRVILANAGHDGPARDPAAFTAAVLEFLSPR
jgi:pimeloyl-ACP methyl ester carboxylesterase